MKKIIFSIYLFTFLVTSCAKQETENTDRIFEVNVNMENDFINIESTKKLNNAHSGDYYSSVDSINVYGAGYVKRIDDTLKGYKLDLIVSAWLRELAEPNEGGIAIALNAADGTAKHWQVLKCRDGSFIKGEWMFVQDTLRFEADKIKDVKEIKTFSMKQNGADALDVDDLRIKYRFYK